MQSILSITTPMNVKELECFLGMITYEWWFILSASEKTAVFKRSS